MNVRGNVDCTARPEGQGVVLSAEASLLYGPREKWYSLPPTFAIIPAAHGVSICGTCANGATCGMTCNSTSSIAENGVSEKPDK